MNGKVLKISNNDLYGNVDDRMVAVFAVFTHKKYMNNYAIFTYATEYNQKKLYCASVHLKTDSLVTFSVRDDELGYITKFTDDYLNGRVDPNEYEILNIANIQKIELVSSTPIDYEHLLELDAMSIQKVAQAAEEVPAKKPVFLYFLLILFILLLGGVTYIYFNPDIMTVELNKLECTMSEYDKKINLPHKSDATLKFNRDNELVSSSIIDTYTFKDIDSYMSFKENNQESVYFDGSAYKYDDETMTLKIMRENTIIIYEYDEVFRYMKKLGYSCTEGVYNE